MLLNTYSIYSINTYFLNSLYENWLYIVVCILLIESEKKDSIQSYITNQKTYFIFIDCLKRWENFGGENVFQHEKGNMEVYIIIKIITKPND